MKININNEQTVANSLLKEENILLADSLSIFFNKNTQSEEISIQDLKIKIETNQILNYPHNFLSLDKTKQEIPPIITINLVDNINIPTSEDVFEHYNKLTGQITITEKLLFNDVVLPSSFPECLYSSVGQAKLLMFAILHEIGHALHHQIYLKQDSYLISPNKENFNNNDFLNLIADNGIYLLGKEDKNKQYDINHAMKYALKEGFADLYACIGLTQIYPQEVALNFIHEVIEARDISHTNSNYYTTESIKQLKEDIEKKNLNLNNFNDLHSYIDNIISNTALKVMLEKLSSDNEEQIKHNNAFSGFLKSLFEKSYQQGLFNENPLEKANSSLEVIEILDLNSNEFNINLNHVKENKEYFNKGYLLTQSFIHDIKDSEFLRLSTNITSNNINHINSNRTSIQIQCIRKNSLNKSKLQQTHIKP